MTRRPLHDDVDAIVGLGLDVRVSDWAFVVVKRTFTLTGEALEPAPVIPLEGEIQGDWDAFPFRSDLWPSKALTDVVVEGHAHTPGGAPRDAMTVVVGLGESHKRVDVVGDRELTWTSAARTVLGGLEHATAV